MPLLTAPDSGYTPTTVDLYIQGADATETDGDIARLTIPYGGRVLTDQCISDIQAAVTTAMLAAFPGGSITQSTVTYTGQVTVTDIPAP